VYGLNGLLFGSFCPYDDFLGIKAVQWSPDGKLLAISTYDEEIRLLSSLSWEPVWSLSHPANFNKENVVSFSQFDHCCCYCSIHYSLLILAHFY